MVLWPLPASSRAFRSGSCKNLPYKSTALHVLLVCDSWLFSKSKTLSPQPMKLWQVQGHRILTLGQLTSRHVCARIVISVNRIEYSMRCRLGSCRHLYCRMLPGKIAKTRSCIPHYPELVPEVCVQVCLVFLFLCVFVWCLFVCKRKAGKGCDTGTQRFI